MLDRAPVFRCRPLAGCLLLLLVSPLAATATPREEAGEEQRAEPAAQAELPAPPLRHLKRFPTRELDRPAHRWLGEPISLSLRDADLVEVLRSFGKLAKINLVIDPAVQGKVTVELHDVPWDQALYVILKSQGLGMEVSGNVWSLTGAERLYREKTSRRMP